jgi:hypothetical protein
MIKWLFKKNVCKCEKTVFKKVENNSKNKVSNPFYYEIRDGENQYLFTQKELETALKRATKNLEYVS